MLSAVAFRHAVGAAVDNMSTGLSRQHVGAPCAKRAKLLGRLTSYIVAVGCLTNPCCLAVVVADSGLGQALALAQNPAYASVGWIGIQEGAASYRGTGVLVSPEWVLTAAHNWLTDAVSTLEFHIGGSTYSATPGAWTQNPGWLASPEVAHDQGADIALFHLSSPVAGITPATLYAGTDELGKTVTLVGAGSAGTAATGPRPNATPVIYACTNVIDRVIATDGPAPGGLLAMDFDDGSALRNALNGSAIFDALGHQAALSNGLAVLGQSSTATLSLLEGTSAAGDSGGPAFADFGNGPEVVGLVSWGVNPTNPSNLYGSGSGDITYLTRVAAFHEWVYATIPEGGVVALMAVTVCLWGMRRRGRRSR